MDKVIIDGVDVSGCNMKCDNGDCALYYAELNNDNNELIYGFNCSDNQDCYYKQLKRLEQENEELKKELEKHKSNIYPQTNYTTQQFYTKEEYEKLQEENEKLKQENERLKEENEEHKKEKQILHERLYCYAYEKDCHIVCKQQNCILKNGYTYRNTLKEIKEIAEQCYDPADKDNDTLYSIFAKINEVIGAE